MYISKTTNFNFLANKNSDDDLTPQVVRVIQEKDRNGETRDVLILRFFCRVDRELLKNIVLDPDPNNQAAALATLDEVKTLMDKGMSTDEIMNVLQSTPRRKQAEGGLSYLMGM